MCCSEANMGKGPLKSRWMFGQNEKAPGSSTAYDRAFQLEPNNPEVTEALRKLRNPTSASSNSQIPAWIPPSLSGYYLTASQRLRDLSTAAVSKASLWWYSTSPKTRTYTLAGLGFFLLYFLFLRGGGGSRATPSSLGGVGGGLSWTHWGMVMYAAYKLPPMFPDQLGQYARPFFGMSWTTFMWLLDMFTRNMGRVGGSLSEEGVLVK